MPSRWQVVGEQPQTTTETGTLVWESGVLDLTPECVEDTGENELVVPVSRAAQSWRLVNWASNVPCRDEYGVDQGPYDVIIPQVINVTLMRSCGTSP